MEKELKIHQNLIENKVFMDEMIRGLRFDSNFIARVGKEGRFTDERGLAIGDRSIHRYLELSSTGTTASDMDLKIFLTHLSQLLMSYTV